MLRRWIHHAVPELGILKILEWGPGFSIQIMLEEVPECEIWSFEHEHRWYDKYKHQFSKNENVHLFYVRLEEGYAEAPSLLDMKFHFIFIDGRERVNCMNIAYHLLEPGGYVMLYDSTKGEYSPGKAIYRIVQEEADTAVMVKDET